MSELYVDVDRYKHLFKGKADKKPHKKIGRLENSRILAPYSAHETRAFMPFANESYLISIWVLSLRGRWPGDL
jgi:hypothetical protein